ncbi:MAG: hypothetical protein ACI319_10755 [Holdemanella porci]
MRKFILNLLTILTWIYQVICVLAIISLIVVIGVTAVGLKNPGFRAGFESGMGMKGAAPSSYIGMFVVIMVLDILMCVASFLVCQYARLIIKNINREIYFAVNNLDLLKKLLISVAGYTVISIVNFAIFMIHRAWFAKYASSTLYPSGITNGLLFLAVLYVVYLVFKYGMKVQEDADSII